MADNWAIYWNIARLKTVCIFQSLFLSECRLKLNHHFQPVNIATILASSLAVQYFLV